MVNKLVFFYYIFTMINANIWLGLVCFVPTLIVLTSAIMLCFTSYGRYIFSAGRAKRFVKRHGMLTTENNGLFYDKCIKKLPVVFILGYNAYESGVNIYSALSDSIVKPIFKGKRKLLLALFDGITAVFVSLFLIVSLLIGESAAMLLFVLLAPLPVIITDRLLLILILYCYENKARRAYKQLIGIINNEWAGKRRVLECNGET